MKNNYSLKNYNTFGFETIARCFAQIDNLETLRELIVQSDFQNSKKTILSGGSNVIFANDFFDGVVVHPDIKGYHVMAEDESQVVIRCNCGEAWKEFVDMTVEKGLYGLENISDIPGKVGAAPVQNIGAYGSEISDSILNVLAINLTDGTERIFSKDECRFSYRNSIFKLENYNKYMIYAVDFILLKKGKLKIEYGNIKSYLSERSISQPSLKDVSMAIKSIRAAKLPAVETVGSAGSFFKNAVVTKSKYEELKSQFADIPSYPSDHDLIKIPSGWLIEKAGWKGYRENHVGVWDKQALVLVHYGGGKSSEIFSLMKKIQESVFEKFGIEISAEVNIIGC